MTDSEIPPRHYGYGLSSGSFRQVNRITYIHDLQQILLLKHIPSDAHTPSPFRAILIIDLLKYSPRFALLYLGEPITDEAFSCIVKAVLSNVEWRRLVRSFKSARHVSE